MQQREQKITKRRSKIEHLLSWQRRLDEEEKKLKLMEQDLLNANKFKLSKSPKKKSNSDILNSSFEMVKSINKSLKMLDNVEISHDNESVDVGGSKMNKLWYRLTGFDEKKFIPNEIYRFTKRELAEFYENAKEAVLESDLKFFLEQSQVAVVTPQKRQSYSESNNEKIDNESADGDDEEDQKASSPNDTMDSIANIETEEEQQEEAEYTGSYERDEDEVITPNATETENDDELQEIMVNQMKVFVDHKQMTEPVRDEIAPATINNVTFQVQRKSQGEKDEHETTNNNESSSTTIEVEEMEIVHDDGGDEESLTNTEPIESIDLSAVDENNSIIPEMNSIQVTDMDDNENEYDFDDDLNNFDDDNARQQMIEDISFPNLEISLNETAQHDYEDERGHDLSTITECTEYEQLSSEPISSDIVTHTSTTPTSERINSEIEQLLVSINDSLEQVEEAFRKVPIMSTQTSTTSATYSTDQDFEIESHRMQSVEETEEEEAVLSSKIATSTPKIVN